MAHLAHYAFVSLPYASHVRAFEALAHALLARGHRVSWVGPVDVLAALHDPRIERWVVGAQTHPQGAIASVVRHAAHPGGPLGLRRVVADLTAATEMYCRDGVAALRRMAVDAIVADQMEAAGGLLAGAIARPHVSVACALPINREPAMPLPVMRWPWSPGAVALKRNAASTRIYDWVMAPHDRAIAACARRLGVGARANLDECLSSRLQLSQTTVRFDFPRMALPRHVHAVGPLRLPASVERPLDIDPSPDRPFVFASLGTLQGGRFDLFRRVSAACRALDVQLLVAHCGQLDAARSASLLQAGASWVTDFAPQRAALHRADAVVTHAGLNTVLDALAAGTPMLTLPIAFDQPGVAARVVQSGAGLRLSARLASAPMIAHALHELLADPRFARRADMLGAEVRASGGAPLGARLIESLLERPSPERLPQLPVAQRVGASLESRDAHAIR